MINADVILPHEEDPEYLSELARDCAARATRARLRAFRISEALPLSAEERAEVERLLLLGRGEDDSESRYLDRLGAHLIATGRKPGERVAIGLDTYLIGRSGTATYVGAVLPDDVQSDREHEAQLRAEYAAAISYPGR